MNGPVRSCEDSLHGLSAGATEDLSPSYYLEHRGVINAEEPFGILPANNHTCMMYPSREGYPQLTQAAYLLNVHDSKTSRTWKLCCIEVWTSPPISQPDQGIDGDRWRGLG